MELNVSFKKKLRAFDLEVSFSCRSGQLLALVGPSGSGKTTIIRMIAGLEKPDEGTITYNGETWVNTQTGIFYPPQKRRLSYVFQEYTLFPNLSVYHNVCFSADGKERVEGLLKFFGIWHLRDCKPQKISGGERQRCAICQALARQPQVLLLDEPFSALDVVTRENLREKLKSLKKELTLPMIHVTHNIHEALFLADDILPVVRGKVEWAWLEQSLALGLAHNPER